MNTPVALVFVVETEQLPLCRVRNVLVSPGNTSGYAYRKARCRTSRGAVVRSLNEVRVRREDFGFRCIGRM